MNLQQYANIYSSFHNVFEFNIISETIVIPIADISWTKSIVLKLKNFVKVYEKLKPLAKSIMFHFKMETNCTIFTTEDSWSVLLGDEKLVYPKCGGESFICSTQYFVKDPKSFYLHMKSNNAIYFSENVYFYRNAVIYLDKYDIPYPGGKYFDEQNICNSWNRICFLTTDINNITKIEKEFSTTKDVWNFPNKMKHAEANISKFMQVKPINEVTFPETYYENTNIILKRKCFKNPDFIIQDILESSESFKELGIIIEYPICISYLSFNAIAEHKKFICLSINCNVPKTVIHVPAPYDRFYQYRHCPKNLVWTPLLYDKISPPNDLEPVILNKNIIGYMYKDTFFCLAYPKLLNSTHMKNKNTEGMLNMLSFDLKLDNNFKIVNMYRYDTNHSLYCVKHKNFQYELWCLSLSDNFTSFPKRIAPTYLVSNWSDFLLEHTERKEINYGDLKLLKLMFILARHKICFFTRESKKRDIVYEHQKDIIFKLESNVIDFINSVRLNLIIPEDKSGESSCTLL